MASPPQMELVGVPDAGQPAPEALLRSRLLHAASEYVNATHAPHLGVAVGDPGGLRDLFRARASVTARQTADPAAANPAYAPRPPDYSFERLIVADSLRSDLLSAVRIFEVAELVFGTWGLRVIEPHPRSALNFFGPPGTGKTMAAHAIAHHLNRSILCASYAEIESKFHGEGPKNVKALFLAAEASHCVLFIDEADSLLSRRLTNVTQGSEQAINSMRSQLLICLEGFSGIVIFATNLVENYDPAFETRVRHVRFELPDLASRNAIWRAHLPPELPLAADVSVDELAESFHGLCGRDIKNSVIDAAVRAALAGRPCVSQSDLAAAARRVLSSRLSTDPGRPLTAVEKRDAGLLVKAALRRSRERRTAPTDEDRPRNPSTE